VLLLNGNELGEEGARHLMHALTINKCLKYLGLQASGGRRRLESGWRRGRGGGSRLFMLGTRCTTPTPPPPPLCVQGSNLSAAARDVMGGAAEFNPSCPDGAYQLDLAAAADRAVAQQLAALDVASGQDLMRNITLDGRNLGSCRKAGWPERLPTKGVLSCDFVSRRLKRDVPIIDGRKFNNLVKQVRRPAGSGRGRLMGAAAAELC
jgi:hypothetical protein